MTEKTHGGARKGAGRKAGSATKRTREIADQAAKDGITPLEVMLKAMTVHYENREWDDAAAIAAKAAPYMHPHLAAIEHSGKDGDPLPTIFSAPLSQEEWLARHSKDD